MASQWSLTRTYDPDDEVNLSGLSGSLATYAAAVTGLVAVGRATGHELPERYSVSDLLLGGIATHKLSRLITKGSVTSPLRSPFTRFEEPVGSAEHQESPRGSHGVRHTIGELLTCPFCMGVWIGTGYVAALSAAPRAARAWAAVFTVVATSDALHHGYERLRSD